MEDVFRIFQINASCGSIDRGDAYATLQSNGKCSRPRTSRIILFCAQLMVSLGGSSDLLNRVYCLAIIGFHIQPLVASCAVYATSQILQNIQSFSISFAMRQSAVHTYDPEVVLSGFLLVLWSSEIALGRLVPGCYDQWTIVFGIYSIVVQSNHEHQVQRVWTSLGTKSTYFYLFETIRSRTSNRSIADQDMAIWHMRIGIAKETSNRNIKYTKRLHTIDISDNHYHLSKQTGDKGTSRSQLRRRVSNR